MKKRRIGKTALDVTEFGFGGASLGNLYQAVAVRSACALPRRTAKPQAEIEHLN